MKSAREAKEFLITQIVLEVQRKNVALSEVERKMLYFSETDWTLPDMAAVYEEFDAEYNQSKYEQKIARLIRGAYKLACKGPREIYEEWWANIRFLDREDHYLSVMIRRAGLRPRHDQLKLFLSGLLGAALTAAGILLSIKYDIHLPHPGRRLALHASLGEYIWVAAVCLFIAYQLLRFVIGAKRTDDLTSKALRAFARGANRVR